MLMAEHKRAVLVVLQGMDASGKDGTVKHCLGGLNPMSVRVAGFKAPTSTELAPRLPLARPPGGSAARRDRHLQPLALRGRARRARRGARAQAGLEAALRGHQRLRAALANEGTTVVKLFLHLSEDEQAKRFRERISDPTKNWKFSPDDLAKRAKWDDYMTAYRAMLERRRRRRLPWHIVPADHKWVRDAVVTEVLTQTLEGLDLQWPELSPELKALRSLASGAPRKRRWGRAFARPPAPVAAVGRRARQRSPPELLVEVLVPAEAVEVAAGHDRAVARGAGSGVHVERVALGHHRDGRGRGDLLLALPSGPAVTSPRLTATAPGALHVPAWRCTACAPGVRPLRLSRR